MNRQVMCFVFGVLMLFLVSSASATLVGYWPLDGDAMDASGNGLHGTIVTEDPAGEPNFVAGAAGLALDLSGVQDYVNIDGYKGILAVDGVQQAFSVANWFKSTGDGEMVTWGINGNARRLTWRINGVGLRTEHSSGNLRGRTVVNDGEWHHGALVVTEGANLRPDVTKIYIDGVEEQDYFSGGNTRYNLTAGPDMSIGRRADNNSRHFPGTIDEVHLYSRALSPEQVMEVMNGGIAVWLDAGGFDPGNGALVEASAATLSWNAGDGATSHNVYFGTTPDLGPDQLVSQQTETEYAVTDLAENQTYYWRIDEVLSAPDANDIVTPSEVSSFFVPPQAAYDQSPADGAVNVITGLSWTGGWSPLMHAVYLSTDAASITSGAVEPTLLIRGDTALDPGALEPGTTYYWAVDEFYGTHWSLGSVLSFTTAPDVAADPNADPSLVARWTFDEGEGTTALDSSGNNYHAMLVGDVNWVASGAGEDEAGGALHSSNDNHQYGAIKDLMYETTGIPEVSVFAWIRTASQSTQYVLSYDRNEYYRLAVGPETAPATAGQVGWYVQTDAGTSDYASVKRVDDDEWHHVAGVFDNGVSTIYIDGVPEPSQTMGTTMGSGNRRFGFIGTNSEATSFDGNQTANATISYLDDLRIYDRAFQASEMRNMFTNVAQALNPDPADGATVLPGIVGLTWEAGEGAVSHDIYIAENDFAAVDAGSADTFIGNQAAPALVLGIGIPPDPFVGGLTPGATYYWRIDEVAADGTVTPGKVWSFTLSQ